MADTFKMALILIAISVLLYAGQIVDGDGNKFADNSLIKNWIAKDDATENFYGYSGTVYNNSDTLSNPSSVSSGNQNSFLNFWDVTQIVWGFVKMIFNIFFAIPLALLGFNDFPIVVKLLLIIPLVIGGFIVITLGIFGRR